MSGKTDLVEKGTLTLKINKVSSYMKQVGKQTRSPPQHVAGIEWHVLAYSSVVDKITRLSCFLVGENSSRWTAWVDATFRIVKANGGGFGKEASFRRKLLGKEPLADVWVWKEFVTSKRLLSAGSGFVVDDFVEIRVDFSVSDVCGASFDVFETDGAFAADIKLKAGDSVFYANKGYLSVVSSVFRDTFALTEGKKDINEIELNDLDAGEFKEFLGVIYPTRYPITDANVVSLFRIEDRYNVQRVVDDCKRHLLSASKVPGFDKLKLSVDLNRDDLRKLLSADRGFVVDHSVEIPAGLSVADTDGALFNAFETVGALAADIKLKVGDSVFYANKGYLSVVSSVFRDIFALTEAARAEQSKKDMDEIELKDLEASDFKEFLGVVYPTCYAVTDSNVLNLFRIADRFDVKSVVADCEYHLLGANNVPLFDKLKLAADLNRDHLKNRLISEITCDDIQTVFQNENKKQLGMDVLEALMDEHIRICRP